MYDNGSRKECKTKSVLNHEGMNAMQINIPPVIYLRPEILYQEA